MFSTVDGSVRLVIAVTKFGLKQNLCEHIDQIREGVGTPLFGLVRYVSFAEHSIPVSRLIVLQRVSFWTGSLK